MELLTQQNEDLEARSRRKILLVHGVEEAKDEDTSACVVEVLSKHLADLCISCDAIGRSHRLGRSSSGKPRAILVKFRDLADKDKVWLAKKNLKGTGITVSEFLTKDRRAVFLSARQRFGIGRVWTKSGSIMVLGADKKRYHIRSNRDLEAIPMPSVVAVTHSSPVAVAEVSNVAKTSTVAKDSKKEAPQVKDVRSKKISAKSDP